MLRGLVQVVGPAGDDGDFGYAHSQVYKGLERLDGVMEQYGTTLDNDEAVGTLNGAEEVLHRVELLTEDIEDICQDLRNTLSRVIRSGENAATISKLLVEQSVANRAHTLGRVCWCLRMKLEEVIYEVGHEGRIDRRKGEVASSQGL